MSEELKVGDSVECVDADGVDQLLEFRKVYKVINDEGKFIQLENIAGGFLKTRFRLPPSPKPVPAVGQVWLNKQNGMLYRACGETSEFLNRDGTWTPSGMSSKFMYENLDGNWVAQAAQPESLPLTIECRPKCACCDNRGELNMVRDRELCDECAYRDDGLTKTDRWMLAERVKRQQEAENLAKAHKAHAAYYGKKLAEIEGTMASTRKPNESRGFITLEDARDYANAIGEGVHK